MIDKTLIFIRIILAIAIIALIPTIYLGWGKITGNCIGNFHIQSSQATCEEDSTCMVCGKVLEKATGHIYPENRADCDENVHCFVCGAVRPKLANHTWISATCTTPSVCANCGQEYNNGVLGHNYVNGKCTRCGEVNYGIWGESYYVDKYGDKTNKKYIYAYSKGTFSNSATTNSKVKIEMLFDIDSASIMLWEYESVLVTNPFSRYEFYNIYAKNDAGNEIETRGTLESDGDRIEFDNPRSIYNILSKGGNVKFVIENRNRKIERYSFTIDANGFKYLWDKNWIWK